ncbi:hypothetical protein KBD34_04365 [Patescibacteria group bacterium]|nr:hypothetical protein [Patescibacteria group bacterium]
MERHNNDPKSAASPELERENANRERILRLDRRKMQLIEGENDLANKNAELIVLQYAILLSQQAGERQKYSQNYSHLLDLFIPGSKAAERMVGALRVAESLVRYENVYRINHALLFAAPAKIDGTMLSLLEEPFVYELFRRMCSYESRSALLAAEVRDPRELMTAVQGQPNVSVSPLEVFPQPSRVGAATTSRMDAAPPSSGQKDRPQAGEWPSEAVLEDETPHGIFNGLFGDVDGDLGDGGSGSAADADE